MYHVCSCVTGVQSILNTYLNSKNDRFFKESMITIHKFVFSNLIYGIPYFIQMCNSFVNFL